MAEWSGTWTTGGATGDQNAGYTQAMLSDIFAILSGTHGKEGVAVEYLNGLAGTVTGANTVQINTGGALVDGKVYKNGTAVSVNIPSAVGGGNTRIDRIVLRASWAGFTVRITRIAGTDAASPSAPAITQTSGTTYDIMLYQALVDTAGAVTLTDERVFGMIDTAEITNLAVTTAKINDLGVTAGKIAADAVITAKILDLNVTTGKINDLAVTAGKLAADAVETAKIKDAQVTAGKLATDAVETLKIKDANVTYAKLANGACKLTNRQGGSASDWSASGTTNRTLTTARIEAGAVDVFIDVGASSGTTDITFPVAFSNKPLIFLTIAEATTAPIWVPYVVTSTVATTGFRIICLTTSAVSVVGQTQIINWIAIGPE